MSQRKLDFGAVYGTAAKALAGGGRVTGSGRVRWDISCRCERRVDVSLSASDIDLLNRNRFIWVEMTVRCRKCPNCLKVRSWEWAARARAELAVWPRSYLVTLTLSPEEQYRAICEATAELISESVDPSTISKEEYFAYRCKAIGVWITLYLKRVRRELGVALRYVLVAEAHKSGDPHFHMLVHECQRAKPDAWDTYCVLKSQWPHGHSSVNGITPGDLRAARYVCKYLSKSALARVRASARYGRGVAEGPAEPATPEGGLSSADLLILPEVSLPAGDSRAS